MRRALARRRCYRRSSLVAVTVVVVVRYRRLHVSILLFQGITYFTAKNSNKQNSTISLVRTFSRLAST